jgi:hypothetical protein
VHCKDARRSADGKKWEWMAMGSGVIDWAGQFAALKRRLSPSRARSRRTGAAPARRGVQPRQSFAGMKTLLQKAGALS